MVVIEVVDDSSAKAAQLREDFDALMGAPATDLADEVARLSQAHLLLHDALQNG